MYPIFSPYHQSMALLGDVIQHKRHPASHIAMKSQYCYVTKVGSSTEQCHAWTYTFLLAHFGLQVHLSNALFGRHPDNCTFGALYAWQFQDLPSVCMNAWGKNFLAVSRTWPPNRQDYPQSAFVPHECLRGRRATLPQTTHLNQIPSYKWLMLEFQIVMDARPAALLL